jgi:hypothetical protein
MFSNTRHSLVAASVLAIAPWDGDHRLIGVRPSPAGSCSCEASAPPRVARPCSTGGF